MTRDLPYDLLVGLLGRIWRVLRAAPGQIAGALRRAPGILARAALGAFLREARRRRRRREAASDARRQRWEAWAEAKTAEAEAWADDATDRIAAVFAGWASSVRQGRTPWAAEVGLPRAALGAARGLCC
jgi:hypothetical protein